MKAVPFSDILNQTCQLIGLDTITLNDRSFGAIRDLASRRISQVWDREDWPDVERILRTFPGIPVKSIYQYPLVSGEDTIRVRLDLDQDFARVYLAEFEDDAYKKGTVNQTKLKLLNPFYIMKADGKYEMTSAGDQSYTFEYGEIISTEAQGPYILNVEIRLPISTIYFDESSAQANGALTTTVVFEKNQQLLIQLKDASLHGLEVFNEDPRKTTRVRPQNFIVEDINTDFNSLWPNGYDGKNYSYIRVFDEKQKWVKYRISTIRLIGEKYQQASAYPIGSQVYYTDNFWESTQDVPAGISPVSGSEYWRTVQIPFRFRDFLINGIAADFMRSEGRADEANIFDQLAENSIQQQIDVLVRQQGQVRKMDMAYTY